MLLALLLLAPAQDPADLSRLSLHNGFEVQWLISAPFEGAPVSDFDPQGDLYWKIFPADALRRCDGTSDLMGIRAGVFDTYWQTECLWSYTISTAQAGSDGTLQPQMAAPAVFVPGLSTTASIFGGWCSPQGYVSGWIYNETFLDTAGQPTALLELTADGTVDWAFTHYFPAPGIADHDLVGGPINSCGMTGDATLQWLGSTDGFGVGKGENVPDWTGLGNSIYGGFNVGGQGTFAPIADGIDDGSELEWLFDEPVVTARVDTHNGDGFPGPELGLAALQTPLQVSSGGVPGPGTTTLGVRLHSANGASAERVMVTGLNVGPTLLDLGLGCVPLGGGSLALNPADGGFPASLTAMGLANFVPDPDLGPASAHADSAQVPAGVGAAWIDLVLRWQAFEVDLSLGAVVGTSQVFRQTLRTNDGL